MMPLSKSCAWSYQVQGAFDTFVDDLVVTRRVPVGPAEGWELSGSMGNSRLAWHSGRLLASELGGQAFDPPLPILGPNVEWKGETVLSGRRTPASALIECSRQKVEVSNRQVDGMVSRIRLNLGRRRIEVETEFARGIGVVRQEQTEAGRLQRRLSRLTGP